MAGKKKKKKEKIHDTRPPRADRFPFVGAGAASTFEWAELFVRFLALPSPAVREAIAERVPPPLRDTIEWDGAMLWVASEQGVGRLIKNAYGKKKGRGIAALTTLTKSFAKRRASDGEAGASRLAVAEGDENRGQSREQKTQLKKFSQAGAKADELFDAHIEAWLRDSHRRCPILVAYRAQDWEAGGTELSDWHHSSIRHVQEAIDAMAAEPSGSDAALVERLIEWASEEGVAVKKTVPRVLRLKASAAEEAKRAAEEAEAEERLAKATQLLRTPRTYDASKLPVADEAKLLRALDKLAKRLPKTVKRLKRLSPEERHLRPGASKSALTQAEKKMGMKLGEDARALLSAFDGGVIGDVVILGTEASGAKGADELTAFAAAHDIHVPIARTDLDKVVFLDDSSAPVYQGDPGDTGYRIIKSFKSLDSALEHVLKKGTC